MSTTFLPIIAPSASKKNAQAQRTSGNAKMVPVAAGSPPSVAPTALPTPPSPASRRFSGLFSALRFQPDTESGRTPDEQVKQRALKIRMTM